MSWRERVGAPSTASPLDLFAIWLAMAGGIGLAKKAPGTFGSLPGLALGCFIGALRWHIPRPESFGKEWSDLIVVTALVLSTLGAWWAIARTERVLGIHDDQRIVVDEVVGQAIAAAWLPLSWLWYGLAFALFRFFDIAKPGPIGWIDRRAPGAVGTLFDDVLAGVAALLVLGLIWKLTH